MVTLSIFWVTLHRSTFGMVMNSHRFLEEKFQALSKTGVKIIKLNLPEMINGEFKKIFKVACNELIINCIFVFETNLNMTVFILLKTSRDLSGSF